MSCSTSLTSKGLRPGSGKTLILAYPCSTSLTSKGLRLESLVLRNFFVYLQHLPDFKGIETTCLQFWHALGFLQHLPDFKGIETVAAPCIRALRACSTSLTSNGYTFQTHKKRPVTFTGRFFVVWFQKLFLLGFTSICS